MMPALAQRHTPTPVQRLQQSQAAKQAMINNALGQKQPSNQAQANLQAHTVHNQTNATAYYATPSSQTVANIYLSNSGTNSATTTGTWITTAASTGGTNSVTTNLYASSPPPNPFQHGGRLKLTDGRAYSMELPDGGVLEVKADGSYTVNDKDAKVTYRACRTRDFNSYLNASDKLEDFIKFCGKNGVKQSEMLDLPIKLFIAWLVIESAKADKEPVPDVPLLPDLRKQIEPPRCGVCAKFLKKRAKKLQVAFCSTECFDKQLALV